MSVINSKNPQYITVNEGQEDQRIDNLLIKLLKNVPKSHIYRIVRKGEVRVNKGRIKSSYRVQIGDVVRIPPIRLQISESKSASASQMASLEKAIIYEDDRLLVINKPSGLAVHGGSGLSFGVIECLRQSRPDARFLELVHRLDRDTSGCLILAKKRSCLRYLHQLFRDNGLKKTYLTLVKGRWQGKTCHIREPLKKNILSSGERVVRVDPEGKEAHSVFRPVAIFDETSLMEVDLKTGRTHQIRVHAACKGFPIVGDDKYGDEAFNRQLKQLGVKRLFLHAQSLEFKDQDGQTLRIKAPLENRLETALEKLKHK